MIIRRNKPQREPVRKIVRRQPGATASPPRRIVRRSDSLGVHMHPGSQDSPRRFGFGLGIGLGSLLSWRPGRGFFAAVLLSSLLGLAGAGGYWAWSSPYFKVNTIGIEGNAVIPAESITERLSLTGESMFTVSLEDVQRELQAMPLVQSVHVERRWPDGIHITVVERQPWGTWEQEGVAYTIDSEGVVLGPISPPEGAPIIRSLQTGTRQQGDRVDYQAVDAASALYAKLPGVLGTTVAEISYEPELGLVVRTGDGDTAIFGDSSAIDYKLSVWAAMASAARERHFNYSTIDLRFGNRPVLQ